jgi:hypothetical protein
LDTRRFIQNKEQIVDRLPYSPSGREENWIPTGGKRPLPSFRFYGRTDALFGRSFKMLDFQVVQ